jgi:hypothetical protein
MVDLVTLGVKGHFVAAGANPIALSWPGVSPSTFATTRPTTLPGDNAV